MGEEGSTTTGIQILTDVANKTTASTKEASNLESVADLGNKFQSIVGEVLTYECENVVITDTLSQYVDPTDESQLVIKEAVKMQMERLLRLVRLRKLV